MNLKKELKFIEKILDDSEKKEPYWATHHKVIKKLTGLPIDFEMDDGKIYVQTAVGKDLPQEQNLQIRNFIHNNRYVLKMIALGKAFLDVNPPRMIKGGKMASDKRIAQLQKITDDFIFTNHKNYYMPKMSLVNYGDNSCPDFAYPEYEVYVMSDEQWCYCEGAQVHIFCTSGRWDIKMGIRGEFHGFGSSEAYGTRKEDDKFHDIEAAFKKWLPMKSSEFPEITNFVLIQRRWNAHNPEHRIEVEKEL